jgi:hypothetical protein
MNDLKESNEILKQTTGDLKKQQDEMKKSLDRLNQEKNDWVDHVILTYMKRECRIFFQAKKSDVDSLEEKIRNLQNLLVSHLLTMPFIA